MRGALVLAAVSLLGCGYQFAVGGPGLPAGTTVVYVPVFENRSSEQEAGAFFAEALSEALARDGRAGGPESAARLEGVVVALTSAPAATQRDGKGVGLYRVSATIRLQLFKGQELLCSREVRGGEDYLPSRNLLGLDASRRQAVRRLATRMMSSAARDLCPSVA